METLSNTSSEKRKINRLRRINFFIKHNILLLKKSAAKFLVENEEFFTKREELWKDYNSARLNLIFEYMSVKTQKCWDDVSNKIRKTSLKEGINLEQIEEAMKDFEIHEKELEKNKEEALKKLLELDLMMKKTENLVAAVNKTINS